MLQTDNTGVCSQYLSHTGSAPPPVHGGRVASLPTLLRLQVAPPGTIRGQPWAACTSQVQAAQIQALGQSSEAQTLSWACILCPSQIRAAQVMRCLACTIAVTYRLPAARLSRCALAHLLRQMLTVQTPKKFQSAKKPAYSFTDNVSLGLRLSPSGSGCLSPEGDGLLPAISVQSFVPCAGLPVSQVRAGFSRGRYPTVWFASPNYFTQIALGVFRPDPCDAACAVPPCPAPAC